MTSAEPPSGVEALRVVEADARAPRERILAAAEELLREGGVAALTTRAVADRAGVQPPAIYRAFGDKDGLVRAVAEGALTRYVASKHDALDSGAAPVEALHDAWRRHIDFGLENPGVYLAMLDLDLSGTPALGRGVAFLDDRVRALDEAGMLVVDRRAAYDLVRATGDGVLRLMLSRPSSERDARLSELAFTGILTALTGKARGPKAAATPPRDSAEALRDAARDHPSLTGPERALLAEWAARPTPAARGRGRGRGR